jgi:2-polyprenyl-3-methyl-5-hydroxy-6-metoxy-1,4-benzoquinol methylase
MKCPICNSKGSVYQNIGQYGSLICNECSHIYVDFKSVESLKSLYDYDFYDKYMQVGYDRAYKLHFRDDFKEKIKLLKKFVKPGSSLLEIGCGPGYFSDLLQKEGYSVTGVELNPACKIYAKKHNIAFDNFICEDISVRNSPLNDSKYDAVISWATIEHVAKPIEFMSTLKRYTKKDGYIFIDTGVTNSIIRSIDSGYSKWLQPPHHLHVFSVDSLVRTGVLNQLSLVVFFKWFNSGGIYDKFVRSLKIAIMLLMKLKLVFSKKNEGFIAVIGLVIFRNS